MKNKVLDFILEPMGCVSVILLVSLTAGILGASFGLKIGVVFGVTAVLLQVLYAVILVIVSRRTKC